MSPQIPLTQVPSTALLDPDLHPVPERTPDYALLAALIDSADAAIFSTTLQGIVTSWNPAAAHLFGYPAEQMVGNFTTLPFFPDRLREKESLLAKLTRGDANIRFESMQMHQNGMAFQVAWSLFPIKTAENAVVGVGTIASKVSGPRPSPDAGETMLDRTPAPPEEQAIAQRLAEVNERLLMQVRHEAEQSAQLERANRRLEELNARLEDLATTDDLTGLKNHRVLQERLREEIRRSARYGMPLSILLLDVDRFKPYNDAFGHPAGDAILRRLGAVLQGMARSTDLVARYGGEEFAVILPATDADQARTAAERYRVAIETAEWPDWPLTASFGAATLCATAPDAVSLIAQADAALYESKRIGRNCVTHSLDSQAPPEIVAPTEEAVPVMKQMMDRHQETLNATTEAIQTSLRRSFDSAIDSWARILNMRDEVTEGHSVRVTEMMVQLTRHLGMNKEEIAFARCGAWLHDIGKLAVPHEILNKPGPLTDAEWMVMRQHPSIAYEMLAPIPFLGPAVDIPYCHHEWWDGSGYPRGLKGEEIPEMARLFAVIDVYDALHSDRPYREGWSDEEVRDYLLARAGVQFDPRAVQAFLKMPR